MGASLLPSVSVAACSGASGDVFLASWLWMVVMGVVTVVTGVVAQTCPLDALRPPFHLRGLLLALLPPSMRVPAQLLPAVRWGRREHNGHPLLASVLGIWPGGCGWQGKTASCGLGSVHIHRAFWGISRLSGPELPMDRVETDPFLVLRERPPGPHRARGVVRAGGAAQSITRVCVRASGPSRLSRDLSAPLRSPWIVDGLSTVSVACLNKTLFTDTEVGISYHSTCHRRYYPLTLEPLKNTTTTHGLRVTPKQTVRRPGPPQGFRLWPSVTAGRSCLHWPWVVPPQSLAPDGWGPGHFIPWAAPPWWPPHTLPTLGAIVLAGWSLPPGSFSPPGPASILCSHPCVSTLTPSLRALPQRSPILLAARTEGRLASVSAAVSPFDFPLRVFLPESAVSGWLLISPESGKGAR